MAPALVHVIDDDPAMRDSVAFLLDTAGFDVRLYEAGTALLARLTRPLRGCILTDIRMPTSTGWPCSAPSARPVTRFPS